jgi:hypothetical protein
MGAPARSGKAVSRMAGHGRLAIIAFDIERTEYFHVVPIQHHAEHAGLEVDEDAVD